MSCKLREIKRRTERRQFACAHKRRFGESLVRSLQRCLSNYMAGRYEDAFMLAFNAARGEPTEWSAPHEANG